MQNFIWTILFSIALTLSGRGQTLSKEVVLIETPMGNMKIGLYEETPKHKANFLKLVKKGYYDSLLFHRVINHFMIQGGDHLSKYAKPGDSLGHGDIGYTIPAEFSRAIIHKKGRLAAARDGDDVNPKQASSATQFYIVMGKRRTMEDLKKYEDRINKNHYKNCERQFLKSKKGKKLVRLQDRLRSAGKVEEADKIKAGMDADIQAEHLKTPLYTFNQQQIEAYTQGEGTPHLDGSYTVFGEVIEGMEVIDKIAGVKTDKRDRPLEDIRMKISIVK